MMMSFDYTLVCMIDVNYDFVDYYYCVDYVYDMIAISCYRSVRKN